MPVNVCESQKRQHTSNYNFAVDITVMYGFFSVYLGRVFLSYMYVRKQFFPFL